MGLRAKTAKCRVKSSVLVPRCLWLRADDVDGVGVQVGDDEYENDHIDKEEQKKDLGALEAAKMAIKFLDQVRATSTEQPQQVLQQRARLRLPA